MNLAQKYAYTVYRQGGFSKAAKSLFISQPSLSEMIKKLEKELGFLLFDRSTLPLKLTPQGVIYMEYLEEAFENERIMQSRIDSISETPGREVVIGAGNFVSRSVLPIACREFLDTHNDVFIKLDFGDRPSSLSARNTDESRMNFSLHYTYNPKEVTAIPLVEEQYFLACTKDCPGAKALLPYSIGIDDVISDKKFKINKKLYDVIPDGMQIMIKDLYVNSPELESYINKIPRAPCRPINSRNRGVYFDLMLTGIGSIFVTDIIAAIERSRSRDVLFVPIDNKRTFNAVYKNESILGDEGREFISVLSDIFKRPKSEMFNIK